MLYTGEFLNGVKTGTWRIYHDKDWKETADPASYAFYRILTYDNSGKPVPGKVQDFYITGEKQWEGSLSSFNPEKFSGLCTWYYKNGKTEILRDYTTGSAKSYYESGSLKDETTSGEYKSYYESGKLQWSGKIKDGVEYGDWKEYYEEGTTKTERTLPSGTGRGYYRNGKIKYIESYENGLRDSYILYDENGEIKGARYAIGEVKNLDSPGLYERVKKIDKGGVLDAQIIQMMNFIFYGNENNKYEFKVRQADNYSANSIAEVFGTYERLSESAAFSGKFQSELMGKYNAELKSAQSLFQNYLKAEGQEDKLKIEQQIISILEKIVG